MIRSNRTGQIMFTVELRSSEATLSPADARAALLALGASPVGHLIDISQSGGSLPVPANCMFGVMVCSHEDLAVAADHSITKQKVSHAV